MPKLQIKNKRNPICSFIRSDWRDMWDVTMRATREDSWNSYTREHAELMMRHNRYIDSFIIKGISDA
jgi:hypothetical protein